MTVSERVRTEEEVQEMQVFKELDKGIDDMETGRVIEHDEAMRILKERVKQQDWNQILRLGTEYHFEL